MPQAVKGFKTADGVFYEREDDAILHDVVKAVGMIGFDTRVIKKAHMLVAALKPVVLRAKAEAKKCNDALTAWKEDQEAHAAWHAEESIEGRITRVIGPKLRGQ